MTRMLVLCCALLSSTAAAQESLLARLPADAANVVHLPDPLPHVEALLSSDLLRWALVDGPDARAAGAVSAGDLAGALRRVRTDADKLPRELVLAAPSSSWIDVDGAARLIVLLVVGEALAEAPPAVARRERPRFQKELGATLRGFRLPRLLIAARFRGEAFPDLLFGSALDLTRGLADGGWQVEHDETRVRVRARAGDFFDDDAAAAMLVEVGALASARDRARKPLVAALRALEGELVLERAPGELRLWLGGWAGATGGAPELAAPGSVAAARWELGDLKRATAGWPALIDRWHGGPLGELVRAKDEDDLLGTLRVAAEELAGAGERGSARLAVAAGGLSAEVRTTGARRAAPLAGSRLVELVPADAELVWCASEGGLGPMLRDALMQLEDRLALREVGAMAASRDAEAERLARLSSDYYRHFAPLREVLLKKLPAAAPGPAAAMMWSGGKLDRLEVSYAEGGRRRSVDLSGVAGLDAVLLTGVRDVDEARRLVEESMAHVAGGLARVAGRALPPGTRFLRAEELGLGVPTWTFTGDWVGPLTGDLAVELAARGGARPHLFVVDGLLALSTSVRASQRVLAAARGAPSLPLPAAGGEVIAHARFDRRTLAGVVDSVFGVLAALAGGDDRLGDAHRLIRSLLATVDGFRMVETQQGAVRETRMEARFAIPR
jgi:hypothetical protein